MIPIRYRIQILGTFEHLAGIVCATTSAITDKHRFNFIIIYHINETLVLLTSGLLRIDILTDSEYRISTGYLNLYPAGSAFRTHIPDSNLFKYSKAKLL